MTQNLKKKIGTESVIETSGDQIYELKKNTMESMYKNNKVKRKACLQPLLIARIVNQRYMHLNSHSVYYFLF